MVNKYRKNLQGKKIKRNKIGNHCLYPVYAKHF